MDGGTFRIAPRSFAAGPAANGSFSTFLATQLLGHAFIVGYNFAPPLNLYVTLYTVPPTVDGGGSEVSADPTFARQPIVFAGAPPPDFNVLSNPDAVVWGTAQADWGTVVAAGLWDQPILGGRFLAYGLLLGLDGVTPVGRVVQAGDLFFIPPNSMKLALA